jgi:hypothetical protein
VIDLLMLSGGPPGWLVRPQNYSKVSVRFCDAAKSGAVKEVLGAPAVEHWLPRKLSLSNVTAPPDPETRQHRASCGSLQVPLLTRALR